VYDLSIKMADLVRKKFNLGLIREVRFVGKFEGMPENIDQLMW